MTALGDAYEPRTRFSKREPMFTWFRFIARCLGKECRHAAHLLEPGTSDAVFCRGCYMLVRCA